MYWWQPVIKSYQLYYIMRPRPQHLFQEMTVRAVVGKIINRMISPPPPPPSASTSPSMRRYVFTGVMAGKREAARSSISTDFLVPHEVPQHFLELWIKRRQEKKKELEKEKIIPKYSTTDRVLTLTFLTKKQDDGLTLKVDFNATLILTSSLYLRPSRCI